MKIAQHKAETSHDMQEFMTHDIACCCDLCLDDMERGLYEMEEMLEAEKDCSFHCGPGCGCRETHNNLTPSDCEPQ